jgi:hypothetical protein
MTVAPLDCPGPTEPGDTQAARALAISLVGIVIQSRIPARNFFNIDEKGNQMGGGRRSSGEKCFYDREDRSKYKIRDGNLELVTIVECVCADGTSIMPGFIFSGSTINPEWATVHDDIAYVRFNLHRFDFECYA